MLYKFLSTQLVFGKDARVLVKVAGLCQVMFNSTCYFFLFDFGRGLSGLTCDVSCIRRFAFAMLYDCTIQLLIRPLAWG